MKESSRYRGGYPKPWLHMRTWLLPTSLVFFDALCLGCRARVCGACADDQEIVWDFVTRDGHHRRIRHGLSRTLHQFCLLQVLRMLDAWSLRKCRLHGAPQGRVRYFEIVLSASTKRDRKKNILKIITETHKNSRQDARQNYCGGFWLSQRNIGLIFRNLSKSRNDFFGASSHKVALERKDWHS